MQARAAVAKQIKDAEMRSATGARSRADPPDAHPTYQMKMSSPKKMRL